MIRRAKSSQRIHSKRKLQKEEIVKSRALITFKLFQFIFPLRAKLFQMYR